MISDNPNLETVISDADKAVCLGSGELKPCPFCGHEANSVGQRNVKSGNFVYHVICGALHNCGATVYCCEKTEEEARKGAIENWNKRV